MKSVVTLFEVRSEVGRDSRDIGPVLKCCMIMILRCENRRTGALNTQHTRRQGGRHYDFLLSELQ